MKPCRKCGADRAARKDGSPRSGYYCPNCGKEASRWRYHTNPRARAGQVLSSMNDNVKRKFPAAFTAIDRDAFIDALLNAKECTYCGQPNDGTHPFNLDHVQSLALGGLHSLDNLTPCCEPCNRAKRDMPADQYRAWLRGVVERMGAA